MISFDRVKEAITTRQAAESYGIHVNRHGFACCPFHHERTPSMKVDQRYHCFGCSEDGDVIDFTAKLFGLDLKEAAEKLAADFGIDAPFEGSHIEPAPVVKTGKAALEKRFNDCWRLYCEYLHLLKRWKEQYAPKITDEEWDDRFVEACHRIDQVEYYLDELWYADRPEREIIMNDLQSDMERIAKKPEISRLFSPEGPSL